MNISCSFETTACKSYTYEQLLSIIANGTIGRIVRSIAETSLGLFQGERSDPL